MKTLLSFFLALSCISVYAQVNTVQPSVMVIPFTKEGEDIRRTLDEDENIRQVLTTVKEAFDNRGFSTIDFYAKCKAVSQSAAFQDGNQSDLKSQIIANSGADIYVEAEININKDEGGNSVRVTLTAYEASTAKSLANKVGDSGRFYTTDIGKLGSKAVEKAMVGFLDNMQTKFNDMVVNGKSIIVNIGFDENSTYNTSSKVGTDGMQLSDELELWMENNTFKNYYHIQGTTEKSMIFDEVRIPLKDPGTGRNYNVNKFSLEMLKFFQGLGIDISRDINGGTLYIKIK
jgi:hypothetical protein